MAGTQSVFGKVPKTVTINYSPHAGQLEICDAIYENFSKNAPENQASIIEIIASRGWGKTLFLCGQILAPFLQNNPNYKVMWVAPTYQTALSPIEDVFRGIDEQTEKRWIPEYDAEGNRIWQFSSAVTGPVLQWWNGASVVFKSADSPDSIVSRGFNLIVIDEGALIEERVFTQQIMGTARKKGIKIFIISSPRGKKHWTYKYFLKGQDKADFSYLSFQQPYFKNPFFSPILAKLIKDLPEWIVKQEYMAEFLDDGDSVFKGLSGAIDGQEIHFEGNEQEWHQDKILDIETEGPEGKFIRRAKDRRFVIGMDLAKSVDYTVIYVMDLDTGDCVYYKRFNKRPYTEMANDVERVSHVYNSAELIYDATGVGSAFGDILIGKDVVAHPYVFTNDSKSDLVNRLAVAIEYREIKIPNISTIKNELEAFTYVITRTGKFSYSAPAGFHDDCVMALALANWHRKENSANDYVSAIDTVIEHNARGNRPRNFLDYMAEDDD